MIIAYEWDSNKHNEGHSESIPKQPRPVPIQLPKIGLLQTSC
jgi:hypothetical protein